MIPDELCDFFLSVLIDKDEGVMARVVGIVFMPSFSRMDDVFIVTDRDMQWHVEPFKECFWLLLVSGVVQVNEVGE